MPGFLIGGANGDRLAPPNNIETSRAYRYAVKILEPLTDIIMYAYKAEIPKPEIDKVTFHHKQDEIYAPGKNRWSEGSLTFYRVHHDQALCDHTAQLIYSWYASSLISLEQSSILSTNNTFVKKRILVSVLDGQGNTCWNYDMKGCWPTKISPSSFDYETNGVASITINFVTDKVEEYCNELRDRAYIDNPIPPFPEPCSDAN